MNIAYVRVSTAEQNEARQVEALKRHQIDRWYIEKISGKDMNRPQLQEMLDFVREGDTVFVHDFSRLARSTKDLLEITEILNNKSVNLVSNKEQLDSATPQGKLMLTMIAAINEFERSNIRERQLEGIAIAKAEGKYRGGKPKRINTVIFEEAYGQYMERMLNKVEMAKVLGVSRPTLDKLLAEKKKALNP